MKGKPILLYECPWHTAARASGHESNRVRNINGSGPETWGLNHSLTCSHRAIPTGERCQGKAAYRAAAASKAGR